MACSFPDRSRLCLAATVTPPGVLTSTSILLMGSRWSKKLHGFPCHSSVDICMLGVACVTRNAL